MYVPNHSDGSNQEKDSFLFVGRAQARKKVNDLIRAFSEAVPRIPNHFSIKIVGSGDENAHLKVLAVELGISDRVSFLGEVVDPHELRQLFHKAAALVSPGHVGLAVLHAFAYGVPVVTCGSRAHAQEYYDVKDGINSLVYSNYDELKEILVKLSNDQSVSRDLGHNAFAFYTQERTLEVMVSGLHNAIESC